MGVIGEGSRSPDRHPNSFRRLHGIHVLSQSSLCFDQSGNQDPSQYICVHALTRIVCAQDGNSDEISTTLLHAHCPSDLIRGKKVDGQMYHFTFAVSDFRPNENAECESAVQNGGSISIRVNEYDPIVRTTTSFDAEPKRDSMFQRSPKQAPLVESSKTRHIKVSTLYEPPKAATGAAGAAINRKPRKWITRHGFLGEIGSGTLRYRDTDVLRARFSKRARIAEEDESSSAAEATQQDATTCDDDDDEVQEIEVIDLTIETVDLTQ